MGPQKVNDAQNLPKLNDQSLAMELVAEGLEFPTSMAFLDAHNILVLQKNDGKVRLVSNGQLLDQPVIQVTVTNEVERGLLGIAISNGVRSTNQLPDTDVFLYFTEFAGAPADGESDKLRNRVYKYKYDWEKRTLSAPVRILDLPGDPGPFHNGGKIMIGPHDGRLYAVIGDVNAGGGMLDNEIGGRQPDDKSVILRVDRDTGLPLDDNPLTGNKSGDADSKLGRYYAYGIRNGFGMDFDPVLHILWMTENGPDTYDEINIVRPGLNSGWHKVMGPIARTNATIENDLVMFEGAKYGDPVFSWYTTIGVTDLAFVSSEMLGDKYTNNMFVGDINNGNLYFFEVNENRTGLRFHDPRLHDLVAEPVPDDSPSEMSTILFGTGFGGITDIEEGPDGLLYVLSYEDGKIYRISKKLPT
ncbi:MAG: PQQ-dependent sugar dehydrogenase [Nitrososphaera sp.]